MVGKTEKNIKRKYKGSRAKEKSWHEEQDDYYRRLLYSSQKALRKSSKLVRNLESQKIVRKIKETHTSEMEENYQQLKQLDLEHVVRESLRRLGIYYLNPKLSRTNDAHGTSSTSNDNVDPRTEECPQTQEDNKSNRNNHTDVSKDEESPSTNNNHDAHEIKGYGPHTQEGGPKLLELPKRERELVERILKHKKMQSALEEWNEKVTEYRRWCLAQQEKESAPKFLDKTNSAVPSTRSKKKRKVEDNGRISTNTNNCEKSLFVCLGKDEEDGVEGASMTHYGPGSLPDEKKRNRMGQRQRKAKQVAIEAKEAGRVHRAADSVNWRKKKAPSEQQQNERNGNDERSSSYGGFQPKKNAQETAAAESLHPSWAAAKKESSGIVQFQGKKITFD